jgi:hypothetical protein
VDDYLYCPLEHEYTEASMSLQALKANDLARAQVMQDLTSELPFEIFLALLEKKDEGCPEVDGDDEDVPPWKRPRRCYYDSPKITNEHGTHVMAEITDTSYAVKSLQALDGTVIADDYDFDMELCLEKDPFLDLEIAEEDYEPYMGNWVCLLAITLLRSREIYTHPKLIHPSIHPSRVLLPLTGIDAELW